MVTITLEAMQQAKMNEVLVQPPYIVCNCEQVVVLAIATLTTILRPSLLALHCDFTHPVWHSFAKSLF